MLLTRVAEKLDLITNDPEERFMITGVSWEQYETLLTELGDGFGYRVRYLKGILEIMSPSQRHESYKKLIAMLLETYFVETGINFYPLGSTTLRNVASVRGVEPDECYCLHENKPLPDLVVEVVITSGGISSLELYEGLGVREVWFFENQAFSLYALREGGYEEVTKSELLPALDISLLESCVLSTDSPREILLSFRDALH